MATQRQDLGGGFSVLDGVALVTGAAVASVNLRLAVTEFDDPWDWAWAGLLFSWLATTAAGPFLYLVRRFGSRPGGYPRMGDRLWVVAGLPWVLAAIVRTGDPVSADRPGQLDPAYVAALTIGLAVMAMVTVPVLAWSFLLAGPSRDQLAVEATPWTHRLGLLLAVAWPVQFAMGLMVMS